VQVVLDTVSFQHLLRTPKKSPKKSGLETALDAPMRNGNLSLVFDSQDGLIGEWERTCGVDATRVVFTRWSEFPDAVKLKDALPTIATALRKRLRQLGFDDTIDKVVLRLGVLARDRTVISDDNDFWDPRSTQRRGDKNAPVARLCREELGVTITLLGPLLSKVS
jgi:hypothetical protein